LTGYMQFCRKAHAGLNKLLERDTSAQPDSLTLVHNRHLLAYGKWTAQMVVIMPLHPIFNLPELKWMVSIQQSYIVHKNNTVCINLQWNI